MNKLLLSAGLLCAISTLASPWKLVLKNNENQINMHIDLSEESIPVPGMEMFGPMNGYLNGKGVYGVWMVTSFNINSDRKATIRFSNDLGSEVQEVILEQETDSTYSFLITERVVIKKVVNKKLVPIQNKMVMTVK